MLSNRPTGFTLAARLVNGGPADGTALVQVLFNQIGNRPVASQQMSGSKDPISSTTQEWTLYGSRIFTEAY
jgi:hypothetical protein